MLFIRLAALIASAIALASCGPSAVVTPSPPVQIKPTLSADAKWPWPGATKTQVRDGITRWLHVSPHDGTELELFEFDFAENPKLSFEIYDQDEDDAQPFDNKAEYSPKGVGHVTKHLNENREGKVVVAWNGLFFGYDRGPGSPQNGWANHIGPVVLRGKMYHNVGRHRWTFGVKVVEGKPEFKMILLPTKQTLNAEFDFGADGAQCLVLEGQPKKLEPFPGKERAAKPTHDEAGHIPLVDYMKTSRTSMAWNKDSSKLYLLVVNEPDNELESKLALKHGRPAQGGWTLADLQRFWISFGAWGAINSDGGIVTQSVWLRQDGKYEMLPPRAVLGGKRLEFDDSFAGAPGGGSLLTFYVRER